MQFVQMEDLFQKRDNDLISLIYRDVQLTLEPFGHFYPNSCVKGMQFCIIEGPFFRRNKDSDFLNQCSGVIIVLLKLAYCRACFYCGLK